MKIAVISLFALVAALTQQSALAAYTRTTSNPVYISQIYSNEIGSPFVYVSASLNAACSGTNGLYLYDVTAGQPDWELRKNKMAVLLAAKMADKRVILDYFYDAGMSGWAACYIQGVQIVD